MNCTFKPGDKKSHRFKVTEADIAAFNGIAVHEVCSTFALAREIEWATRLFVLEMKDEDEEGIGTRLEIEHRAPAFKGEIMDIRAIIKSINGNELLCNYTVCVGSREVARGITGQKILKKKKLEEIFSGL